jgi:predicted AAA+ superfamily ATPase
MIGPRQVGKTTIIKEIVSLYSKEHLFLDADDALVREMFSSAELSKLKQIVGGNKIVVIDEAQRIPDIGLIAKLIVDNIKDVQLILSGSSAFELTQQTGESLTGRKFTFNLWPISWKELETDLGYLKSQQELEKRLVFGFYPDIIMQEEIKERLLLELTDSYLFKDVLAYGNIRKPEILNKLLQAIAYQVGSEVNYNELSALLKIDSKTVSFYIDLLEKAFVIFTVGTFSRNLRNEIKKSKKLYFYDNGIRNALIGNLKPLELRNDVGILWENFLMSERLKYNTYEGKRAQMYFWRTKQQQEIDLVEETGTDLTAFEFKWKQPNTIKFSKTFTGTYSVEPLLVHKGNFREFLEV